jgi:hypothetical protein
MSITTTITFAAIEKHRSAVETLRALCDVLAMRDAYSIVEYDTRRRFPLFYGKIKDLVKHGNVYSYTYDRDPTERRFWSRPPGQIELLDIAQHLRFMDPVLTYSVQCSSAKNEEVNKLLDRERDELPERTPSGSRVYVSTLMVGPQRVRKREESTRLRRTTASVVLYDNGTPPTGEREYGDMVRKATFIQMFQALLEPAIGPTDIVVSLSY